MTTRRGFITGLTGFIACAPAIVRVSSLMPAKPFQLIIDDPWIGEMDLCEASLETALIEIREFSVASQGKISLTPRSA